MPRAAIRRNMDDWGRSKDSDGGAETITDMRPGQGEGKEGAASNGSDSVDSTSMSRLCTPLVSWERTTHAMRMRIGKRQHPLTAKGLRKSQPRSMLPVPPHQSAWITFSVLHPIGSLLPSNFTRHGSILLLVRRTRPFLRHFVGIDQGKQERAQAMQDDQPNSR